MHPRLATRSGLPLGAAAISPELVFHSSGWSDSLDPFAVELLKVSKSYSNYQALYGLDLQIHQGEFFSLLGPSGCGKTTTLRLIAGFEEPTGGEVRIDGVSVKGLPAYQRNVNTVFQSYSLFPHLSIFENIAFGLRRRRVAEPEIKQRVGEALDLVQLSDKSKGRVHELSGGQQQRVALARALVNRPAVLLLDEPMAALDSKLRKEMRSELKSLQKTLGITFILVTHDQEEALTLSDRLAVINKGRLEQVCAPREVYERPASRFVAEFIGTVNFLPVTIKQLCDGRTEVEGQGGSFWVSMRGGFTVGDNAELSVRPERLWLSREPVPEQNSLTGTVKEAIFMGPVTRFLVQLSNGQQLLTEKQNLQESLFHAGDAVYVLWDAESGSLLPTEATGKH
ncbi:ABC transporter ATP-binding protein [bacterium]|nr:ABC transporter ATP-binding protein [bacterium]